jgi:ClpP class serine protease
MEYTKEFKQVMDFYRNTTPKQKQIFLNLISDKLTFFDGETSYNTDTEFITNFNGIYHQINITKE